MVRDFLLIVYMANYYYNTSGYVAKRGLVRS